jgi:hypothetical protein
VKFKFENVARRFVDYYGSVAVKYARTTRATLEEGANLLKTGVRNNIRAAGFTARWSNAWRVLIFPKQKSDKAISGALFAFHKIDYAGVFEEGATIRARRGLLWLPLNTVPKGVKSPRDLNGVKLISMKGAKEPLLGAEVRLAKNADPTKQLSRSKLRRGTAGKRGTVHAVPLFHGVSSVVIRKKFNIIGTARRVAESLPGRYLANLKGA